MKSDIIARRELEKDGRKYEVCLERPYQTEQQYWVCEWSLVDDSSTPVVAHYAHGGDSMQALLMVLLILGQAIRAESKQFTFLGSDDTGFLLLGDPDDSRGPTWYYPQAQNFQS